MRQWQPNDLFWIVAPLGYASFKLERADIY